MQLNEHEKKVIEGVINSLDDLIFLREQLVNKKKLAFIESVWRCVPERIQAAKELLTDSDVKA